MHSLVNAADNVLVSGSAYDVLYVVALAGSFTLPYSFVPLRTGLAVYATGVALFVKPGAFATDHRGRRSAPVELHALALFLVDDVTVWTR